MESADASNEVMSLDELDRHLFECADILRGSIDSGRYKDYILPLVFYAAVNGRYQRKVEQIAKEHGNGDDPEIRQVARKIASDELVDGIIIPPEHSWEELEDTNKNVAQSIDEAFAAFEEQNPAYQGAFQNDFRDIASFVDESGDEMLRKLIRRIGEIDFENIPPDMMGEAYMDLVNRFATADAGEYFTPPNITELLVRLLEPFEKGSKFHDPTAGSGGLLVEAYNKIRDQYKRDFTEDGELDTDALQDFVGQNFTFTGQERNPTIVGIGKMNLALHDLEGDIRRGDSLTNPQFVTDGELDRFDYILANFPFSQSGWKSGVKDLDGKYGRFSVADSLPHGSYGDWAFILHILSHLNNTGQAAIIIPHGVLFRKYGQKFRKPLVEQDVIEAIIGLPENLFETTDNSTAVLMLNKDKPQSRKQEIQIVHTDNGEFHTPTGSDRNELNEEGKSRIKRIFDNWGTEERVSRTVPLNEVRDNEYNLNISLYIDTTEPREEVNVLAEFKELNEIEDEYLALQSEFNNLVQDIYNE